MLETQKKSSTGLQTSWRQPDPNFDWDHYSADCPSALRKGNNKIKVSGDAKVFSRANYAQELYNLIIGVSPSSFLNQILIGEHHTGTIYSISEKWAMIDVGYRELAYIDLEKESSAFRKLILPGAEFMIKVMGDKTTKGFILGSVTEGTRQAIFAELRGAIESGRTAYTGTVTQMIPGGGYIVSVQGIDCFMPGSLAGANKLSNFESIIGTDMYVVPVSFSADKGTIVVSHRKYLQAMVPVAIEKVSNAPVETEYTGTVTGTAKFGVFVEFNGCLTGMIHINDLNADLFRRLATSQIQPGEEISFKVKEIISEKKITLTQVDIVEQVNPWAGLADKYTVPVQVTGSVKAIKDYGIFVTIEEGIVGLLHVSELDGIDIESIKKGDPITVTVTRIDEATRKVFLKLI